MPPALFDDAGATTAEQTQSWAAWAVDTGIGFIPVVGSARDAYRANKAGDNFGLAFNLAMLGVDVFMLGGGTSIVVARELARHSDVNMTMRYTHIGLKDQARGVENLPVDPNWLNSTREQAPELQQICSKLQRNCSKSSVSTGHFESQTVSNCHKVTKNQLSTSPTEMSSCGTVSQRKAPSVTEGAKVEAAGIAPASRDPSVRASTCVSCYLVFDGESPPGRVRNRLSSHIFSPEQQPAVILWPARIGVSEHDSRAEVMLRSFVTA